MQFNVENINLKKFTDKIGILDRNISSRIIKCDEIFPMEDIINFVEKHIEIQNAIMMIRDSEVSDYTVFITGCSEESIEWYEKMLCMLFKNVTRLINDGFADKFIVSRCKKEALEIYNILEKHNKLNAYISLFAGHKKYKACGNDYSIYKITVTKEKCLLKDEFINWCDNAIKSNSYLALSICGFTLKEIKEKKELINIFSLFPNVYILFCGEYSVGGYVIKKQ